MFFCVFTMMIEAWGLYDSKNSIKIVTFGEIFHFFFENSENKISLNLCVHHNNPFMPFS